MDRGALAGYSPWAHKEWDITEHTCTVTVYSVNNFNLMRFQCAFINNNYFRVIFKGIFKFKSQWTTNLLSVSIDLPVPDISYHRIIHCVTFEVCFFPTQHDVFEVHPLVALSELHSFLWSNNISLWISHFAYSITSFMNMSVVSIFPLLWIVLLWMFI